MAIEYKDINQLTQKSSVAGTEKIEVSDTEYITPSQIAGLAGIKVYELTTTWDAFVGGSATIPSGMGGEILADISNGIEPVVNVNFTDEDGGNTFHLFNHEVEGSAATFRCIVGNHVRAFHITSEDYYSYSSQTLELTSYRVTSVSSSSDNSHYPTAKAVYDSVKNLAPNASPALTGTPTAPTATAGTNTTQIATTAFVSTAVSGKADKVSSATNGDFAGLDSNGNLTDSGKKASDFQVALVSGTNIKTINNQSLLGSGNITISGGGGGDTLWESGSGTNSIQVVNSEGDASGNYSTVEGKGSVTGGSYTENTLPSDTTDTSAGSYGHAEGRYTISNGGIGSHSEGNRTIAAGGASHAEGNFTKALANFAHAEGNRPVASGAGSHAEGEATLAKGLDSHAEGMGSNAQGNYTHAECGNWWFTAVLTGGANATQYSAVIQDQEGVLVSLYNALGNEMFSGVLLKSRVAITGKIPNTVTAITSVTNLSVINDSLNFSFTVEKTLSATALTNSDSGRLNMTMANGANSHSESSVSWGVYSHAEGEMTIAIGTYSHTEGTATIARNGAEHAEGSYNVSNKASDTYGNAGNTQHSIGVGTSSARKNAVEVMQNGDVFVYGVGGYDGTNISQADTLQDVVGGGGGSTTDCVHKTGDETVGGDKTFTDDVIVGDASNIKYGASSGSAGFTKETETKAGTGTSSLSFTGLSGEPKAFVINIEDVASGVLAVVGDSAGLHGIYNTGSQHNYSAGFTKSYSNGTLTITAPTGVTFASGSYYGLTYYHGSGTLAFKTSTIQPGSGVTAATFTGTNLTEVPAMYACFLETAVNNESYRRVAMYTNSAAFDTISGPLGITFLTGGPTNTTTSFSVSYNNGLVINSGGTNAGGYFHNPGTYTLYYLMASDIGGGGGSYQSLDAELSAMSAEISAKQDALVSGTNIKTINSTSLLGSGNINIASLPTVTTTNNGQILEVSNGAWAAGRTITISSSEPTAYQGNNGDIWIVI